MFVIVVLGVWTIMHAYVFWRAYSVPLVSAHLTALSVAVVAALLWLTFPLGMFLDRSHVGVPRAVVFIGATWLGILFLAFAALLLVDVLTGGGYLFPKSAPTLRGWALLVTVALSAVGLVQGLRDPVITDYEVRLAGLPVSRDGLVLVELSDMHLGTLIGRQWMARQVARVNAMKPDVVVVDGDLVDGNIGKVEPLLPVLKRLHAPLGVWAVTGNHEFYAGVDKCVRLFEDAGYVVLRDRSAEVVPGLVFAGVDDLTARRQFGLGDHPVRKALAERPPGATVLLSHTPWEADVAAAAGTGLMLSGHTHDGQIWPFGDLVRLSYPLLGGRFQVNGMTVVVCRGTGTWGPRMRLWRPSEIVRITLRSGVPDKEGSLRARLVDG
jgi:predicted MPP superfamily phosphohydrolase